MLVLVPKPSFVIVSRHNVTCSFTVVFSDHCSLYVPNIVKHRLHVCFICNILPRSRELTLWIFVEEEDLLDLAGEDGHDLGEGGLDVPPLPGLGPPVDDDREPGALQCEFHSNFYNIWKRLLGVSPAYIRLLTDKTSF